MALCRAPGRTLEQRHGAGKGARVEKWTSRLFVLIGVVNIGFVLLICLYLVASGLPAIGKIGLGEFLFGTTWASTAKPPQFGILPFILCRMERCTRTIL